MYNTVFQYDPPNKKLVALTLSRDQLFRLRADDRQTAPHHHVLSHEPSAHDLRAQLRRSQ
jgi:hypothetical protein